jgi:hypothetical protein
LGINITLYLDELAKVFFKKDNRRNKGLSWLSTFYSFCIQSLVRTALLEITKIRTIIGTCTTDPAATQYLYLPLRLFIASNSGPKDPLFSDENSEIESPGFEDYKQAREAVNYAHWSSTGIQNSGEYLKRLFQDNGNALDFTPAKAQATPAIDNEGEDMGSLKRQRLNLFKCNQCRDARKKVSSIPTLKIIEAEKCKVLSCRSQMASKMRPLYST